MQLCIFTEPQLGATYDQQLAIAKVTEEEGFEGFFRSDHFLTFGNRDPGPGPTDSWVTLAGLARETERVRLGTLVSSATFRLPGLLAVIVAEVDDMSGGRIELGLGAGWYDDEHRAYGVLFSPLKERIERLAEQLEIIHGMWSTPAGQRFSFKGRHYLIEDSPALPKPVQRPHPPLIVGGGGPRRTPALAAQWADEFNLAFRSLDDFRGAVDRVRQACEEAGRDPASLVYSAALSVCCGRDEAEVERRARATGRTVEEARRSGPTGTPAEVIDYVARFRDAGAQRVYFQVLDMLDLDHVRLLGQEVRPQLA